LLLLFSVVSFMLFTLVSFCSIQCTVIHFEWNLRFSLSIVDERYNYFPPPTHIRTHARVNFGGDEVV
jgi:hypothetical protein